MPRAPNTLSHEQVDAKLQAVLRELVASGARPEQLRILYQGLEWRWSPVLRRWDLFDEKLAARPAMGGDDA
jgi:hypothetical protein